MAFSGDANGGFSCMQGKLSRNIQLVSSKEASFIIKSKMATGGHIGITG